MPNIVQKALVQALLDTVTHLPSGESSKLHTTKVLTLPLELLATPDIQMDSFLLEIKLRSANKNRDRQPSIIKYLHQ